MKKWYDIVNKEGKTVVRIYKEIGGFGVKAEKFISDFEAITNDSVDIHINSPGGSVFEGWAIFNHLMHSEKTINVYIDSLAASAASWIALTGDRVYMAKNARFMIHRASTGTWGNKKDHEKTIEFLEGIDNDLVDIYHQKTNLPKEEILSMMDKETWMNAAQAKKKGFIDEIVQAVKIKNSISLEVLNSLNFQNIPADLIETLNNQTFSPNTQNKEEQMDELLKLLGVQTQAEAIKKITQMNTQIASIPGLENQIKDLRAKQVENRVDQLISENKLNPDQKQFALSLAESSPEQFEAFVTSLKPAPEAYTKDDAEKVVNTAIEAKKILPSQKDSLINLGITNKKALDDFLTASGATINLSQTIDINKPNPTDPVDSYQVEVVES